MWSRQTQKYYWQNKNTQHCTHTESYCCGSQNSEPIMWVCESLYNIQQRTIMFFFVMSVELLASMVYYYHRYENIKLDFLLLWIWLFRHMNYIQFCWMNCILIELRLVKIIWVRLHNFNYDNTFLEIYLLNTIQPQNFDFLWAEMKKRKIDWTKEMKGMCVTYGRE